MANTFIKLSTVTVGSSGAASIDFTSIPQTFTDLKIVLSARTNRAAAADYMNISFNSNTVGFTGRGLYGSGSAASSSTLTREAGEIVGGSSTASVFANTEIYIPNYTSSNYKSFSTDSVAENNATASYQNLNTSLWSNTSAITSVSLTPGLGTLFNQYSTATLYGIKSS